MKYAKLFFTAIFTLVILSTVKSAYAILAPNIQPNSTVFENIHTNEIEIKATPGVSIKPIRQQIEIKAILRKNNALKEVDRRLENLSKLTKKIEKIDRLSEEQKETLLAQVKVEITKLNDLKIKIDEETDSVALQEEKKSISDSYKVYALFIPKIELLVHADKIITISNAISNQTLDTGLLEIVSSSKAKAQSVIGLVMPLIPEDFPSNKSTLKIARDMLKDARISLNSVFATLKK